VVKPQAPIGAPQRARPAGRIGFPLAWEAKYNNYNNNLKECRRRPARRRASPPLFHVKQNKNEHRR
jgi:hypothetical protein